MRVFRTQEKRDVLVLRGQSVIVPGRAHRDPGLAQLVNPSGLPHATWPSARREHRAHMCIMQAAPTSVFKGTETKGPVLVLTIRPVSLPHLEFSAVTRG